MRCVSAEIKPIWLTIVMTPISYTKVKRSYDIHGINYN